MKLSTCIHQFFGTYLPSIKGVSNNTIKAYRDTFKLFLPFAAKYQNIKIKSLQLDHLLSELILSFLDEIEQKRNNTAKTRNHRLAAIKSLAKMIRFMYPEKRELAERILNIPQKRMQKKLIGFLHPEETFKVLQSINLKKKDGFRDYTILHLLYDSGARASEIATLNLDYFNPLKKSLGILGKGNRYRLINLWPKTAELIKLYIAKYRKAPKMLYQHRLFINQRGEEFTKHGIYYLCKKYLSIALPPKRLKDLNPVHSFRHACAVNMLSLGCSESEIRNHLGHEDMQSTSVYIHLDLSRKRQIQKQFIEYTQSALKGDPIIDELIDWKNKEETLTWIDSL